MPNWVDCELTIVGKSKAKLDECLAAVVGKEDIVFDRHTGKEFKHEPTIFDFERILPMPAELHSVVSGNTKIDGVMVENFYDTPDGPVAADKADLIKRYGAVSWYEWAISHWGTKWNASEARILTRDMVDEADRSGRSRKATEDAKVSAVIGFQTAWSPPIPIIIALSDKFPKLKFVLDYWEGGMGFQGTYVAKNGETITDVSMKYNGPRGG